MIEKMAKEGRDKLLDGEALAVKTRFGELRTGEMGLDRLDESLLALLRDGAGDRLRPSGVSDFAASRQNISAVRNVSVGPKAEGQVKLSTQPPA
jgi:hypothetical protein